MIPQARLLPFRRKVQILLTTAVGGSLALAAILLFAYQVSATRDLIAANIASLARATAVNCSAAAVFGNSEDARETLASLSVDPGITHARLTRLDGTTLADYSVPSAHPAWASFLGTSLRLDEPVLARGERVGQLTLQADFSHELGKLVVRYGLVAIGIVLLSAILALRISSQVQKKVSEPLQSLAEVAEEITRSRRYDLRAPENAEYGEVASFTHAFNAMLGLVQKQDDALRDAQIELTRQLRQLTREVNERKRMEAERIELERQVLATQKLESLGLMASGIAHDFNNLLTPILGHLTMLERELPDDSSLLPALRESISASRTAAGLCRQMLAYAGKARFELVPLDLNAVIAESQKLLHASCNKRHRLHFAPTAGLPPILGDHTQLQQILLNLVLNAGEAIPAHTLGRIEVTTRAVTVEQPSAYPLSHPRPPAPGAYVLLEVTDNGGGISEAHRQRIFEPFFTTKFTGRGLGLAAVLGIVQSHRATISLESTVDQGTTFRLLFPTTDRALPAPVPPTKPTSGSTNRGVILIVDDEPAVLSVSLAACRRLGYEVHSADCGSAGINLYRQLAPRLGVVLLDQTMPDLDGTTAARLMHDFDPAVPIVMMSGLSEREARDAAADVKFAGFIQKPFDYDHLNRLLATAGRPPA